MKNFNMITAFDVIEHVNDIDEFIKQVSKCLNNNGYFVFSTIFIDVHRFYGDVVVEMKKI